jgi:lipopolysaccharide biosynthesis glycosyltransferase
MNAEKKNRAVVFGLTADHIFAVACVMMDLKRLSPDLADEVVVIHDGVSEADQKILMSILPTRFILYEFPIKDPRVLHAKSVQHFSKMVFTKFECLRLLNDYKDVMWLDYDIVVQADLSGLFSPCESGIKMMPGGLQVRGQLLEEVSEYDMNAEGICASTFVFQKGLGNHKSMYEFCYQKLGQYAEVLYMPEQAIFDFMIQEFRLTPTAIDRRVYSPHPSDIEDASRAKIIHAYGQPKFWNGLSNEHWDKNYTAWLRLGGSRYALPSKLSKVKRRVQNLFHRLKFL